MDKMTEEKSQFLGIVHRGDILHNFGGIFHTHTHKMQCIEMSFILTDGNLDVTELAMYL